MADKVKVWFDPEGDFRKCSLVMRLGSCVPPLTRR